ncbi:hypothetical protein BDV28DRAFT_135056, partial [Aspergillus coremiiformis]
MTSYPHIETEFSRKRVICSSQTRACKGLNPLVSPMMIVGIQYHLTFMIVLKRKKK